jgi:hypothetical protein
MTNYLERVARSAAGLGPRARPPVSGPPLPVGMPLQAGPPEIDIERLETPARAVRPQPRSDSSEPAPRNAEPRPAPAATPPSSTPLVPVRADRITFPAFVPGASVRIPKTLRPSEPQPAVSNSTPPGQPSRVAGESPIAAVSRVPAPPARLPRADPPAAADARSPIAAAVAPQTPVPPPPLAATPSTPERRARLHIGHLDLQVINTPPARPEIRPAKTAAPNPFLESRLLERSWFRL